MDLPIFNDSSSNTDTPPLGPVGGDGGNNSSTWLDVSPSPKEGVGDGDEIGGCTAKTPMGWPSQQPNELARTPTIHNLHVLHARVVLLNLHCWGKTVQVTHTPWYRSRARGRTVGKSWPGASREYRNFHSFGGREGGRLRTKKRLHSKTCTARNWFGANMNGPYQRHRFAMEVRFNLVLYVPTIR